MAKKSEKPRRVGNPVRNERIEFARSLAKVPLHPDDAHALLELEHSLGFKLTRGPRGRVWNDVGEEEVPIFAFGRSESYTYGTNKDGRIIQLNLNPLHLKHPAFTRDISAEARRGFPSQQLATVPDSLFELRHLKYLDLRNNAIGKLSARIFDIDWTHIRVGDNRETISKRTPDTRILNVSHNPISFPPPEILERGLSHVRQWLKSLSEGSKALNEVKILMLGDGFAGKTSLQKRLRGEAFDITESQTHGINIQSWPVESQGRKITSRLWDFGGQEIMHATHQFFLSKRSIYVVVLDGRREDHTEYWLKMASAFGATSPICVVINKIDENPSFDVNRSFLKAKYPSIVGFVRTSCKTGEGILELRQLIAEAVGRTEIVSVVWPTTWLGAKMSIEKLGVPYLDFSDYKNICAKAGVDDSPSQETLRDFLNDLGVALHFQDLELEGVYILDPGWVTSGVYSIINAPAVAASMGILKTNELKSLLDNDKYPPGKRRYILELMKRFELGFSISSDSVLIPDLLSVQRPAIPLAEETVLRIRIEYSFLPRSLLARFLVRMHRFVENGMMWRSGCVLLDPSLDSRAIVESDTDESLISMEVSGDRRREYVALLIGSLRALSLSYSGISWTEHLVVEKDPATTFKISYEHMIRLEQQGTKEYLIDGMTEPVNVAELLGTVRPDLSSSSEAKKLVELAIERLRQEGDSEDTVIDKVNNALLLRPNIMGLGIDINNIVKRFFRRAKKKKL